MMSAAARGVLLCADTSCTFYCAKKSAQQSQASSDFEHFERFEHFSLASLEPFPCWCSVGNEKWNEPRAPLILIPCISRTDRKFPRQQASFVPGTGTPAAAEALSR